MSSFPSPADDHAVQRLDLMRQLIRHPEATFLLRVRGDAMRDAGILDGAVLLVDRAIKPQAGHVVVATINGELVCKTLVRTTQGAWLLRAAHPAYADSQPHDHETLEVWGVVVASIVQHA
jgi:DNA polymerase V